MSWLIAGMLLFVGLHMVPVAAPLRQWLVRRLGLPRYRGLFSLVSAIALGLIVYGKANAPHISIYIPPHWGRQVVVYVMPLASVLLIAPYLPGFLRRVTRHPMLLGLGLWAASHLFANGDLASVTLFGGFLAFALVDLWSQARRPAATVRAAFIWADGAALAAGIGAYVAMLYLHPYLFGVSVH